MISKLILGTVQFGLDYGINNKVGKVPSDEVRAIFDYAKNNGIRILDTAEAYGNATELIGSYHKATKHQFSVITKFNSKFNSFENLEDEVIRNLRQLNISNFLGYLYHSYDDFKNYKNIISQLENLKTKGYIKHIGISIYTNEQFEEVLDDRTIEIIQLPYNLLDNFNRRGDLIRRAKEKGKIIHTRSVFLQGLFFKNLNTLPKKLLPLKELLKQINHLASEYNIDIASLALNYVLANPDIDGVLVGVDCLQQLKKNISSAQSPLPKKLIDTIDNIKVKDSSLLNPSNWL